MDASSKESHPIPVLKNSVKSEQMNGPAGYAVSWMEEEETDTEEDTEDDESTGGEEMVEAETGGEKLEDPHPVHYAGAEVEEVKEEEVEDADDPEVEHYADDESSDSEDSKDASEHNEPDYFVPGYFTIVVKTVVKRRAVVSSPVMRSIEAGEEVFIRNVIKVNNRLRGKLRKGGWISIVNHSTNVTFAQRKPDKEWEVLPKKKKHGKRVTFAPTSRSLRALKRNSVTSLCDGQRRSLAQLADEASKRQKKREPFTTSPTDTNPVWYQRYYYDVASDSDSESSSNECNTERPCLECGDCLKKIPDLDNKEDMESLPEIPTPADIVNRFPPCKELKKPIKLNLKMKITELQETQTLRKCSEDSSANVGNFSSPSIDLQSSEEFSFQAESIPSSSDDDFEEGQLFHKNFDREVFLKSLSKSNIPPPPEPMNGNSHQNSTRVKTASFKIHASSTPNASCGGDDEQSSSQTVVSDHF